MLKSLSEHAAPEALRLLGLADEVGRACESKTLPVMSGRVIWPLSGSSMPLSLRGRAILQNEENDKGNRLANE
jgi:hypothetical protein